MNAVIAVLSAILIANTANAAGVLKAVPGSIKSPENINVVVKYKDGVVTAQGVNGPGGTRIFSVRADEAEAFSAQLRTRPEVDAVALDVIVRNPPLPTPAVVSAPAIQSASAHQSGAPNDPGFDRQTSWLAPDEFNVGVQNMLAGYLTSEPTTKLRVGVLDSGFYPVSDIVYAEGYNLSAIEGYGPAYLENEVDPGCNDPHGTAVAGIIGATANNGIGIAGILDADLVATRVLSCGTGFLSDTALGIRWLAGDPSITEAPPLSAPADIINASLGARVNSCPFYLQAAIDYAHARGILVVVAAGNDSQDAQNFTPANCRNVLTVGAVGKDGAPSSFSNYGDGVEVGALGELVATIDREGEVSRWFGTSFAAPLVAGAAGLLKQANPSLTPDDLHNELIATSRPLGESSNSEQSSALPEEEPKVFRAGIVDAGKSMQNVMSQLDQLRPDIRPALEAIERCNRAAYLANVPAGVDYSRLFEVTATSIELDSENQFYAVLKTTPTGDKEFLHLGQDPRFLIRDVDLDTDQLWFDVCNREGNACRFDKNLPI